MANSVYQVVIETITKARAATINQIVTETITSTKSHIRSSSRDAYETYTDKSGEKFTAIIERFDISTGKFPSPIGIPKRGSSAAITISDSLDLTTLPADLTSNLVTVGDKSVLFVSAEQTVSNGSVTITPILYDNQGTPSIVGLLEPKTITQSIMMHRGSVTILLPTEKWLIAGAYKIGLHITAITGTSNSIKLYGWVI